MQPRPRFWVRPVSAGFTLVEILVVMVIMGLLATFVTLSMGSRKNDDAVEAEAKRLKALMELASDEAQLQGMEIGFRHTVDGYEFLHLDPGGTWLSFADGPLRARKVELPIYLELRIEGRLIQPARHPAPSVLDGAAQGEQEDKTPGTQAADARGKSGKSQDERQDDKEEKDDKDDKKGKRGEDAVQPQAFLLSSGEATAFTLDVKAQKYRSYFRLNGDVLARFALSRQEEKP